MEKLEEILDITRTMLRSGKLQNKTVDEFIVMSFLRVFHRDFDEYGITENDAKKLRAFFHNYDESYYYTDLKALFLYV